MRTPYLIHMFIWVALFVYVKTLKNVQTVWYMGAKIQNGHVHSNTCNILFQYFFKNVCVWHVWTLSICIADVLICVCLYVFVCLCLHLSVCVCVRERESLCACVCPFVRERKSLCACVCPLILLNYCLDIIEGFVLNVTCRIWMIHVTYEWDMSHMNDTCHIWMSHVTYKWDMSHMNETCHIWKNRHICGRVRWHTNGSCNNWCSRTSYQWVVPRTALDCSDESCRARMRYVTFLWDMSSRMRHGTYEWYLSRINEACHVWMRHVTYGLDMSRMNESGYIGKSSIAFLKSDYWVGRSIFT